MHSSLLDSNLKFLNSLISFVLEVKSKLVFSFIADILTVILGMVVWGPYIAVFSSLKILEDMQRSAIMLYLNVLSKDVCITQQ